MGSNITILKDYLNGIADAIRYRGNTTDAIKASDFKTAIRNLPVNIIYNVPTNEETGKPDEIIQVMNYYYPEYISFQNYKGDKISLEGLRTNKITLMNSMFANCDYLLNLDVSNFNTELVTTMASMFSSCANLRSLNLSNFNGANVISISSMFTACSNLTTVNLSNFNACNLEHLPYVSNPSYSASMFSNTALVSLDMSNFNGHRIQNMGNSFSGHGKLQILNLSGFNGRSLINLSTAFSGLSNLTSLNLTGFNVTQVTNMYATFLNAQKLSNVDFMGKDIMTNMVTNIASCFYNCKGLTSFNYPTVNLSNVVDLSSIFYDCDGLQEINLSSSNFSKLNNCYRAFSSCNNLHTIDFSGFNGTHLGVNINMAYAFSGDTNLQNLKWDFSLSNVNNIASLFSDCKNFSNVINFANQDLGALNMRQQQLAYIISDCGNLIGLNLANCNGSRFTMLNGYDGGGNSNRFWHANLAYSYTVRPFNGQANSFLNMHNFNGGNMNSLYHAFSNCNVCHLDLSDFNGQKVTQMSCLCLNDPCLITVNLSNFGSSNITSFSAAFENCINLTSVNLSNCNTISGSLSNTFYRTHSLQTINYTGTTFNNITSLRETFRECGLTNLDLTMFNFNTTCDLTNAFYNSRIRTINFGNQLPNMKLSGTFNSIFQYSDLESFNMSDFANCDHVNNFASSFTGCKYLETVNFAGFGGRLQNIYHMFYNCQNLKTVDFANVNMGYVNTNYAFNNCFNLTTIKGLANFSGNLFFPDSDLLSEKTLMNIIEDAAIVGNETRLGYYIGINDVANRISNANIAYAKEKGWGFLDLK